ncbi:MAG: hypothetical protein MK135_14250, partial [Polyangiaceae bacterium]|nr:hypothetical protein [Polyangiaceae bacterium]
MIPRCTLFSSIISLLALPLIGCAQQTPPAASAETTQESAATPAEAPPALAPTDERSEFDFVQGVAGGIMVSTVELEAEVLQVNQKKRSVQLKTAEGEKIKLRVGEGAVNFYQVEVGDRVHVSMAREVMVYAPKDETAPVDATSEPDGAFSAGAGAPAGAAPQGVMVSTMKMTGTITKLNREKRKATLSFDDGTQQKFDVREDVD